MSKRNARVAAPQTTNLDAGAGRDHGRFGRKRFWSLLAVHVAAGLHYAHWKVNGSTVSPFELNEAVYTLELGILTTGALLFASAILGSAVFGRFFCGWACHVVALQDASAWVLRKLRIPPRPIRSRLLLLVPFVVAGYMFLWPEAERLALGNDWPGFRVTEDADGWGSFKTASFLRNLPGPGVTAFTFFVVGGLGVYLLGTRSFCAYACPYGAVFQLTDRLAPYRLRLKKGESCAGCGVCTSVCDSRVRVHEELAHYGTVVDPRCLKDLDCVAACPRGALTLGFGKPSLVTRPIGAAPPRRLYDFTLTEELIVAALTLLGTLIFRGLYGTLPFFLSIVLGIMLGVLVVFAGKLARRPDFVFARRTLRKNGRLTAAGMGFLFIVLATVLLTVHSAFVRLATGRAFAAVEAAHRGGESRGLDAWEHALTLLARAESLGLLKDAALTEKSADAFAGRAHERLARGDRDGAESDLRNGLAASPLRWALQSELGTLLAERGDLRGALRELRAARATAPTESAVLHNLAVVSAQAGFWDEALRAAREAARLAPNDAQVVAFLKHLEGLVEAPR